MKQYVTLLKYNMSSQPHTNEEIVEQFFITRTKF